MGVDKYALFYANVHFFIIAQSKTDNMLILQAQQAGTDQHTRLFLRTVKACYRSSHCR